MCTFFDVFFDRCAQHFLLLDANFHTPDLVASRSAFLLAAICTVASRYMGDERRAGLNGECFDEATRLAAQCLSKGTKSVEIVQGLLLLSMWMPASKHWEDDRAWVYSGLAMRIATDLGLSYHQGAFDAMPYDVRLEVVNRQRTWLCCYAVDKSFSALMGKPDMLHDDELIVHCRWWCLVASDGREDERLARPWHAAIAAFVDLLRTLCRQLKHLRSWNLSRPTATTTMTMMAKTTTTAKAGSTHEDDGHDAKMVSINIFNEELDEWNSFWNSRKLFTLPERCKTAELDRDSKLLVSLHQQWPLRLSYARLIVNSFGLQHCLNRQKRRGKEGVDVGLFFAVCWRSARGVILAAKDGMRGSLRWGADTQLVMVTYASVFLLKLVRSQAKLAEYHNKAEAVSLVRDAADLLGSLAAGKTHTATLYASFLRSLLDAQPQADTDATQQQQQQQQPTPTQPQTAPTIPSTADSFGMQLNGPDTFNFLAAQSQDDPAISAEWFSSLEDLPAFHNTLMNLPEDGILNDSFWSELLPSYGYSQPHPYDAAPSALQPMNVPFQHSST